MMDELHLEVVPMTQPDGTEHFQVRLHTRSNYWTIGRATGHDKVNEVIDKELGLPGYSLDQVWHQDDDRREARTSTSRYGIEFSYTPEEEARINEVEMWGRRGRPGV